MTPDLFSCPKTEEHKKKLSLSLRKFYANGGSPWNKGKKGVQKGAVWSEEQKKAHSSKLKGRKCPWLSEWNRKNKTGQTVSLQQRKKLSKSLRRARATYAPIWNKGITKETNSSLLQMAQTISRNTKGIPRPRRSNHGSWRRFWYYGKDVRIRMRSRWEVAYAHYLDSINEPWLYEYCTFEMGDCSYTPDFYLPRVSIFHEVKGWMDDISRKKIIRLAKHFGCKLKVIGPRRMAKFGLIDRSLRVIKQAA